MNYHRPITLRPRNLLTKAKALKRKVALQRCEALSQHISELEKNIEQTKREILDKAVAEEMETLKEEWEVTLDELETESAHLLEQLNGAGVELSSLYKWIEKQVPNGCCTETWKNTTHWAGTQMPSDVISSVAQAEEYLQTHRPVRRIESKLFAFKINEKLVRKRTELLYAIS
ncbi:protein chromatin remodeling 20 [Phtheirospermum japonicum]|uniref:Protein chromatin remodeling 20 n=1 Tax=Phtheirospermum japonicum TaxID=374723 RepID=A0A830DCB0_9LAMI|nr:protein chromatin remodeling 20 [Phtheirospermum japonicum]